jgi:hypothetical protein
MPTPVTYPDLVRQCNVFLHRFMYPDTALGRLQHRDLVRTFFAGAFEALMLAGDHESVRALAPQYKLMTAVDWFPDPLLFGPPGN